MEKRDAVNLGNRLRGEIEIGASGGTCSHTLPADNGLLFYSATEAKWLVEPKLNKMHDVRLCALRFDATAFARHSGNERRLVGSAGNAPVVASDICL